MIENIQAISLLSGTRIAFGVTQPKMLRIRCSTNAKSKVRQQWNADLADAADKKRIQTRVYLLFPPHPRSKMLLPIASVYLERSILWHCNFRAAQ